MLDELGKLFLQQGIMGAIVLVLAVVLRRRDEDLTAERKARIADANQFTTSMVALQAQVLTSVNQVVHAVGQLSEAVEKLADIAEAVERRERERKRP